MQCYNGSEKLWLLSVCNEVQGDDWGIFHFIGHWKGLKIKKIYVRSQKSLIWITGEVYLIRIEVTESDNHMNFIKGLALESKKIDIEDVSWEPF